MRKAFTLLELMVVVAVIGLMLTLGVSSITAGKDAVRVKGATRDIFGAIRRARSTALVTGKPAVITYSTVQADGETMAKVEIVSEKLLDTSQDRSKVQTLSGEPLQGAGKERDLVREPEAEAAVSDEKGGETVEDILFAPPDPEVVKGMRLKVLKGDEALAEASTGRKTKVSVFSNVDYLLGLHKEDKAEAKKPQAETTAAASTSPSPAAEDQAPVSVVWETNGRVEPHQVWVYADGERPEDGMLIRIDRFGAAKVLAGDGTENE